MTMAKHKRAPQKWLSLAILTSTQVSGFFQTNPNISNIKMFQTQFAYLEEMHRKEGELKTEERGSYNERAKVSFVSHHARIARIVFIQRNMNNGT